MSERGSRLTCTGCGVELPLDDPRPFSCPNRRPEDDVDHVLKRRLTDGEERLSLESDENPFLRFRQFLHSWHVAQSCGMPDDLYVDIVREVDRAVAMIDGAGFVETPYGEAASLGRELGFGGGGSLWLKDETGGVSGSHKARHLMSIALFLAVAEECELCDFRGFELSIASCGNAALAAAVLAKATERTLRVCIPTSIEPDSILRLGELDALFAMCDREESKGDGDPCMERFHESVDAGAIPFGCQGNENALCIEGGQTLVWELVLQHRAAGAAPLDRMFIQVGGGALFSACFQGLREAERRGAIDKLPALHPVQAEGGHPFERAWRRVVGWLAGELGGLHPEAPAHELAAKITAGADAELIERALEYAATHRSEFMWPWGGEPRSLARGILDDETYDWLEILRAVLETGGWPVVASEESVSRAYELAQATTGVPVCPTGTSGLAGLIEAIGQGRVLPTETVAVLFTGADRG